MICRHDQHAVVINTSLMFFAVHDALDGQPIAAVSYHSGVLLRGQYASLCACMSGTSPDLVHLRKSVCMKLSGAAEHIT